MAEEGRGRAEHSSNNNNRNNTHENTNIHTYNFCNSVLAVCIVTAVANAFLSYTHVLLHFTALFLCRRTQSLNVCTTERLFDCQNWVRGSNRIDEKALYIIAHTQHNTYTFRYIQFIHSHTHKESYADGALFNGKVLITFLFTLRFKEERPCSTEKSVAK